MKFIRICVLHALLQRYNLAGFLINIVFSSLFLGTQIPQVSVIWKQAGPQLMYGMLIAWGQWIVALVVTGALLVSWSPINLTCVLITQFRTWSWGKYWNESLHKNFFTDVASTLPWKFLVPSICFHIILSTFLVNEILLYLNAFFSEIWMFRHPCVITGVESNPHLSLDSSKFMSLTFSIVNC